MKKTMIVIAAFSCSLLWTLSCFALTPDQVIKLKKAGVSDKTIQLMIKQEEAKDPYATMGTIEVKDKDGNSVIIYTTGNSESSAADDEEAKKVEKAWEMLNNIFDKRNK
jgi:hypothetical protein